MFELARAVAIVAAEDDSGAVSLLAFVEVDDLVASVAAAMGAVLHLHDDDALAAPFAIAFAIGMGMGEARASEGQADPGEGGDGGGAGEEAKAATAVILHHLQSPFQLIGVVERTDGDQAA